MTIHAMTLKTERDLVLVNLLSALLVVAIVFFPDSPVRILLGLPFILFFPGYVLICALFPEKKELEVVERLALSLGLSIAVTSLMGLALNYTPTGIKQYPVISSLFSFTLLMSTVVIYRRRVISTEDTFAPLASISISGWHELTKNEFSQFGKETIQLKIITIIAFTFITFALTIIAKTPPASGYEVSIYDAYPWYFWFSILAAIFLGLFIQTKYIFSQKESNFWYVGLFVVVFTTVIILLLPIFRDYYTIGRGDLLYHLGIIKNIIVTSHIKRSIFYPIIHILGTCIVYITNISLGKLPPLLSTVLYIIYVGGFYLLGSVISKNSHHQALITILATPLFYMTYTILIFPAFQSLVLIPLILYLYHKSRGANTKNVSFAICTIIILFAIIYFHPITGLYMIAMLLVFCIFNHFHSIIIPPYIREKIQEERKIIGKSINLTTIAIILFLFWYLSYSAIVQSFRKVTEFLVQGGESTGTVAGYYVDVVVETGPTIYEFVKAFVNNYGPIFMLLLFCVFCIIYWLKTVLSRKDRTTSTYTEWVYVMIWVVSFSTVFFEMFAYVVEFNPVRNIRLLILVSTILTGLLFYNSIERHISARGQWKKLASLFLVFIVLLSSLCILNVYQAPQAAKANTQVTEMEVSRFNWFADHFDNDIEVASSRSNTLHRFNALFLHRVRFKDIKLPQHFGYDKNESVAEIYDLKEVYILYNIIELRYPYKYSKDVLYNEEDISKLGLDSAVAKIYSNGELTVWKTIV